MYGLRRVCLPVTGLLLSASTIHLLNLPSETSARNLSQAMHDLQIMSTNHFFAGRCVNIIRSLASKWQISLPEDVPRLSVSRPNGRSSGSPKSAFYSASIPRQNSSHSGTRSAESQESNQNTHHDSPFAPPISVPQSQGSTAGTNFFGGDQFPPVEQSSLQQPYWLPFPVQSMPNVQLADLHTPTTNAAFGFSAGPSEPQWPHYDMAGSNPTTMHQHTHQQHLQHPFQTRPPSTTMRADGHMGHSFDNWAWQ